MPLTGHLPCPQLAAHRITGRGELSTLLGAVALSIDITARTLGFTAIANETATRLSGKASQYCDAYARGVNAALVSRRYYWCAQHVQAVQVMECIKACMHARLRCCIVAYMLQPSHILLSLFEDYCTRCIRQTWVVGLVVHGTKLQR